MPDEYSVIWEDLNGSVQNVLNEEFIYGTMMIWGTADWALTEESDRDWVAAYCGMSV